MSTMGARSVSLTEENDMSSKSQEMVSSIKIGVGDDKIDAEEKLPIKITSYEASGETDTETDVGVQNEASCGPGCGRSSKRAMSCSNDSNYERDRFKARVHTFNRRDAQDESGSDSEADGVACEVCERIGTKTAKLNFVDVKEVNRGSEESPLSTGSEFYGTLASEIDIVGPSYSVPVKSMQLGQLSDVFDWYFNQPLPPTKTMFPWLHGISDNNYAQKRFFVTQSSGASVDTCAQPEDARFLMNVLSDSSVSSKSPLLRNTVVPKEILQPIDVSRADVIDIVGGCIRQAFPQLSDTELDRLTHTIIRDAFEINHLPIFLDLDPDRGVSLRNFHIQVAKITACSDFIVYCFDEKHPSSECKCSSLARLLWLAQRLLAQQSDIDLSRYNVFLIKFQNEEELSEYKSSNFRGKENLFSTVSNSTSLPPILGRSINDISLNIDAGSLHTWDYDFQLKEKVETTKMSSATRLHRNLWVGNFWDSQLTSLQSKPEEEKDFSHVDRDARHLYCDPKNSIIGREFDAEAGVFSYLPSMKANWKLLVSCHNGAAFTSLATLSSLLFRCSFSRDFSGEETYNLEFPPSGSIGIGDCQKENILSIVNICKLLYIFCSASQPGAFSSLIYCSDGYTESSFLVLCYLMYAHDIPLGDAIVKLHMEYGRPFYIFNSDVTTLLKLQGILRKFSPASLKTEINWSELENMTNAEFNEVLFYGSQNYRIQVPPLQAKFKLKTNDDDSDFTSESGSESDTSYDVVSCPNDWVTKVEGSMPSRILPYLYLGSLQHANCLPLMSKLGIRQIISVGEHLDWLHGSTFQANFKVDSNIIDGGNLVEYTITPLNEEILPCPVDKVLKVNNLQDDGIDELSSSLPTILDYIQQFYDRSNGDTKILVHCRVGVSRSATVAIAEVMKRLQVSLPEAYMYVRVRRLNIIIQPNLRFVYELFKWEEQENLKKHSYDNKSSKPLRQIDWFVMSREITKLNIPYLWNHS
ncbi:Piso0_002309 [Millerozyma farinosa CBS 7064]|uniref:Piso0_002309 protein n=1 Tax=Pichia sorbitophila (strain ATCC MYA-4447 / BCRC 22081 / CBS 7064 / NBRC 10061 / NRRL Y-12695) TaxID=559304 RepID=G8YEP8_PICSO|nr:Piso0_002309 [Millerozyma farinosa CBS 7064]